MRVTFVIYCLGPGGAERVVSLMANYWAEHDWHVSVLTLDSKPSFYPLNPSVVHQRLGVAGESSNLIARLIKKARLVRVLRRNIKLSVPDAVISFITETNVATLLATVGLSIPVIVSERTSHTAPFSKLWRLLRRLLYRKAARIVVQTSAAKDHLREHSKGQCTVVHNPVLPTPTSGKAIARSNNLISAIGRLGQEKGFDLLLRAFAKVAPAHPGWRLEIWGEGRERSNLETLVEELGLAERARLPGVTYSPIEQLQRADIFVLSSRLEGFPNVLCEAMACGVAVVSFDCANGPRDIIRHGVDGLLVPPSDVEALAQTLEKLMCDEALRRKLGARAKELVQRFDMVTVMAKWETILRAAAPGRQTRL